jgi:hypothetical protein
MPHIGPGLNPHLRGPAGPRFHRGAPVPVRQLAIVAAARLMDGVAEVLIDGS